MTDTEHVTADHWAQAALAREAEQAEPEAEPEKKGHKWGVQGIRGKTPKSQQFLEAERKREAFIEAVKKGNDLRSACEIAGCTWKTYESWRERWPQFRHKLDAAQVAAGLKKVSSKDHEWKGSFAQFRKRFFFMDSPPFHMRIIEALERGEPGSVTLVLVPPEHGKGLALDTELPTPDGWTTIGEARVGDELIASDGTATRVTFVSPVHNRACYRVEFADGSTLVADDEHQWVAGKRWGPLWVVRTDEIAASATDGAGRPRWRIPVHGGFDLPPVDVPCDPWFVGYWIGDGSRGTARISTADPEVLTWFADPWTVRHVSQYDYQIKGGFHTILRKLGIKDHKAVPDGWLRASAPQRLALLQGWMDADGSVYGNGQCELSCTTPELLDQGEELVRSLGIRARRYGHRLCFYTDLPVFRLSRKLERLRHGNASRRSHEIIRYVWPTKPVPTRCLQVEHPSGTFLAGRGQHVTHNTTLLEDYCNYKLAVDPGFRITYASENVSHAKKALRRIKSRMEIEGPCTEYVARFGPFVPQEGAVTKSRQPWGELYFNVFRKGSHDERDYSMAAVGITTAVQGTRSDLLIGDDLQSLKSLTSTERFMETFRQDFLSRPGTTGRTVLVGTRVGDRDLYHLLMESGIIDNLIVIPAIEHDGTVLWPERYTRENYDRMKRNVGPSAWARNYQQRPTVAGEQTFNEDEVRACKVPLRSVDHDPPPTIIPLASEEPQRVLGLIHGLDPGFGLNAVMTCAYTERSLMPWRWRVDSGLTSNQAIFDVVAEQAASFEDGDVPHVSLTIEDKAFQKGLFGDAGLDELKQKFGFEVLGHQTGVNKYDPILGIPSMTRDFRKKRIELPGADDTRTQAAIDLLESDLFSWRPARKINDRGARGNNLQQDLVMVLWFCWLRWRSLASFESSKPEAFRRDGLASGLARVSIGGRVL